MKIPVKTVVTIVTNKDIELSIKDGINGNQQYFQDVINYLLTLKFVASSCYHTSFTSFISRLQGGTNSRMLTYIELVSIHGECRHTFFVRWEGGASEYIILDK